MNILNHFQNISLTNDQRNALESIQSFINGSGNVFMLKGYAGTGKTTLLGGVVNYLNEIKRPFAVLAPTGRAATILRKKTEYGKTIHSCIYKLNEVNFKSTVVNLDENDKDETYKLLFPIDEIEELNTVIIVDEASMISSKKSEHPILQFGTDILLDDLLTYAQIHKLNTKIIFVGDPAQLPPVGDNKSWAFEKEFFLDKGMKVGESLLTEVMRQSNNLILENAILIREKIEEENPKDLSFTFDNNTFIHLGHDQVINRFIEEIPTPEINSGVIVSFSNAQSYHYNVALREKYFHGNREICSGDIIQIVSNNYNTYPTALYNGDFAKVIDVFSNTRTISPSVYVEENGKRIKKNITIVFKEIQILLNNYNEPFNCMIVESLLNNVHRDLTVYEHNAIYIDFIMRFDERQKLNKQNGLPYEKRFSEAFKEELLNDKYVNALRCKYGYAITCHKAQGGEWEKVFVDYSGRISLKKDPLRWCYTATTRAINTCFAINPPNFNRFTKFEIKPIGQISNIPLESYIFENILISPYHRAGQHLCKSKKYWEVIETLQESGFLIKNIVSGDYFERYLIEVENNIIEVEGCHKKTGIFEQGFKVKTQNCKDEIKRNIEFIFNNSHTVDYDLHYNPSINVLSNLYSKMQAYCDECEISITNIVENLNQYFVNYYLKTTSISAYIQFYFNKDEQLTVALPRTYKCESDVKLQQLIDKLKANDI